MKCTKCEKYLPTPKDIYYQEYIALVYLIQHSTDKNDTLSLQEFLNRLAGIPLCECIEDVVEKVDEARLLNEKYFQEQELKEKENTFFKDDKDLNVIYSRLDLKETKALLSQEQKRMLKKGISHEIIYTPDLISEMKLWSEKNIYSSKLNELQKNEILILIDFDSVNEGTGSRFYENELLKLVKNRKIFDKTTYLLFNKDTKKQFINILKQDDPIFFKQLDKIKWNNQRDLFTKGKNFTLKESDYAK